MRGKDPLESTWGRLARSKNDAETVLQYIKLLSMLPRPAGSSLDRKFAEFIRKEFEKGPGFDTKTERFSFTRYITKNYSLLIDDSSLECRPCLCSKNTPKNGIEGAITKNTKKTLDGKIALIPIVSLHESLEIERAARKGAVGALVFQPNSPLLSGRAIYPGSSIPAVCVDGFVGKKLLQSCDRKTITATLKVNSSLENSTGVNVYSFPKDVKCNRLFVAHRDSREFSPGAIDNASGSSLLIHLARNRTRSSRYGLLSTDAEEYGLLGAKHFLQTSKDLDKRISVVNLDSIGTGNLHLISRSRSGSLSRKLNQEIRKLARINLNLNLGNLTTPRGSDSDVFNSAGYDAAWIRSNPTPSATTIEDRAEKISLREISSACRLLSILCRPNSLSARSAE